MRRWLVLFLMTWGLARGADASETRDGRHALDVSFVAMNLTRPGGQLGYTWRAVESPARLHALAVGLDVGAYHWQWHSDGLYVVPRVGWRGRLRSGLEGQVDARLGYLHTFLAGPAYDVVEGAVVTVSDRGLPKLLAGGQLGLGWFIAKPGLTPFVRAGVYAEWPTFDQVFVRFSWNVGLEVRL